MLHMTFSSCSLGYFGGYKAVHIMQFEMIIFVLSTDVYMFRTLLKRPGILCAGQV